MENTKIGYVAMITISGEPFTIIANDPGDVLTDANNFRDNSPEDCMGDKPDVELVSMKRIRYIEEE